MNVDKAVMAFAGVVVLISAVIIYFISPWGLILTVFVGLNLVQASLTGFCPAAKLFAKFGLPPGKAFK
jgi:hypothetical protein